MGRPVSKREIAIGAACAILGLLGGVLIDLPEDDPNSQTYQDEVAAERAGGDVSEEAADAPVVVPTVRDFSLAVRTKEEQCFGSAGCNVTLGLTPTYTGLSVGDAVWDVTYRLEGIEDGASVGTFTLDGDELSWSDESQVQTTTPGKRIRAVITSVDRGY